MADRKNVNKYYPPSWDPSKGSLNKYMKSHPLRSRARKLHEGILIIRFEAPFNMWCEGCNKMIAKGVRFNAEKKCIGNYFSTKIWEFKMRCAGCSHNITIKTDPKTTTYICVSGARQKVEVRDENDPEVITFGNNENIKEKMNEDAMFALDYKQTAKLEALKKNKELNQIKNMNEILRDDFSLSQKMRSSMRKRRKLTKELKKEAISKNLGINLLPKIKEDKIDIIRDNTNNIKNSTIF